MLTPEQARKLSGQRTTVALSRRFAKGKNEDLGLRYAQVGMPFISEHSAYITVHLKSEDALSLAELRQLAAELHKSAEEEEFRWVAVIGVGLDLWTRWCSENSLPLDEQLFHLSDALNRVLEANQPPYALDGGNLFFQVQALHADKTKEVAESILSRLASSIDREKSHCTFGDSVHAGRIYGGRMLHGMISSVDPVGFSTRAIIGDELPAHKGGCFCLTQRFIHDWQQLLGMADKDLEDLIGRDHSGNIIVNDDKRSHVKLVRVNDKAGVNYRLVGQSQPFRNYLKLVNREEDRYRLEIDPNPVRCKNGVVEDIRPADSSQLGFGKELGIYQISYAKSVSAFYQVLQGMIGDKPGYIKCRHLNVSHADLGNYWYVPSAPELQLPAPHDALTILMNEFFNIRSRNGWLFYNTKDYMYRVGNGDVYAKRDENLDHDRGSERLKFDPPVTDRVTELLGYTFSRWHDTWYRRRPKPELGHLKDYLNEDEKHLLSVSIAERKGLASKKTLELLSSCDLVRMHPREGERFHIDPNSQAAKRIDRKQWKAAGQIFDTYRIHPREILVGAVPDYTLGSGFEVMKYLDEEEKRQAFVLKLNEAGAAGHNVPNYQRLLEQGVGGLLQELQQLQDNAADTEAQQFYQSAVYAFEGVQAYLRNYASLARNTLSEMHHVSQKDRENLEAIARRMDKLAVKAPGTLIEAAQLIFSMHCCMHITGESVSIGRLDQLLGPFYKADDISAEDAQEVIDCFWIKMDEKVLLNHRHFNDRLARGGGAITYAGGDFPQGAALNQWVQQVTVGGLHARDGDPKDACNEVTRMCLRAARRIPMNAPCLSLRVHANTPDDIYGEVARLVLSGGGHPLLINDDKIVPALIRSGEGIAPSGSIVEPADARDMVCDGCFEALLAGKSEFAFSYVPVPDAIEMALNRGRTYGAAGPVHIMGLKASFRSPPPEEIASWDEFYHIFLEHYHYKLIDFYDGMLSRYGNLNKVCPSPLLSPLIDGCLERGRDMTNGGARYKMLAPLMNGMACAIDALWAIKQMVFSEEAVFTLPELQLCLICDWGKDMKEPFFSKAIGEDRIAVQAERFKHLRNYAWYKLPKFGQGHTQVDNFGRKVVRDLVEMAYDVIRKPSGPVAEKLALLRDRYGTEQHPFEFVITPGIATFEDYAGVGSFLGASAAGRRNGQTIASDFSPSPTPPDLPVSQYGRPATASLKSWAPGPADDDETTIIDPIGVGLANGSPVDINIREDFPCSQLEDLVRGFANGELGSNMMTISCADPNTLAEAQRFPERYDLVRMRMGGWSEFFVAMFPHHQEQHKRRPVFEAVEKADEETAEVSTAWGGLARRGDD